MQPDLMQKLKHNFAVNILDGAFFGMALGFASNVAIIPLFIATMTDSTTIVGLIASLMAIGWQLPQLFTANHVAGLRRYKRSVLLMSLHERWPYLGLTVVAFALPMLGTQVALVLTFLLLMWQGLGSGLTATAWQSMISKIIPSQRRGTFYGLQSAASALMQSIGVVIAGFLLVWLPSPYDFAACFFIASIWMGVSFYFLARTYEPEAEPSMSTVGSDWGTFLKRLQGIMHRDGNFRWFVGARLLQQFAAMAVSFYTLYAVRRFGMDEGTAGAMAGVMMLAQTAANPIIGWVGDRWGHRPVYAAGTLLLALSAFVVLTATHPNWLYLAFICSGAANAIMWTTVIAFTCEFGTLEERPYYIGLANTTVAPAALLAPLFGGWLADAFGFEATFLVAGVSALGTAALLFFALRDPAPRLRPLAQTAPVGIE